MQVRCSPLVSTPNVNNFLDIRSQIRGTLATSESFFSNSMFILRFWRCFSGSLGRGDGRRDEYQRLSSWSGILRKKWTRMDLAWNLTNCPIGSSDSRWILDPPIGQTKWSWPCIFLTVKEIDLCSSPPKSRDLLALAFQTPNRVKAVSKNMHSWSWWLSRVLIRTVKVSF